MSHKIQNGLVFDVLMEYVSEIHTLHIRGVLYFVHEIFEPRKSESFLHPLSSDVVLR